MSYRIENKYTFIRIPKTGGTTVSKWLNTHVKNKIKFTGKNHDSYTTIPELFKNNILTYVRNPYDRVVSFYTYACKVLDRKRTWWPDLIEPQMKLLEKGFKHYVMELQNYRFQKVPDNPKKGIAGWAEKTQSKFLPDNINEVKLLRFEKFDEDFKFIQKITNCNKSLERYNSTRPKNEGYESYYNDEMKKEVYKVFEEDFVKLGYER